MGDQHRYRSLVEFPEYSAQADELLAKYSEAVLGPILRGLLWGIATNPQAFKRVTWNTRVAKSGSFGLTVPRLKILFQIKNEGQESEQILLCWIEEVNAMEEM